MNKTFLYKIVFVFYLLFNLLHPVYADSPVTSTDFYKAYLDVDMVNYAKEKGEIDNSIAQYLHSPTNSLDKKAAVINALSWNINGKHNANIYKEYLYKVKAMKHNKANGKSEPDLDDKFCLAYLSLMDDYNSPDRPIKILKEIRSEKKHSYTINVILMIAKSQQNLFNGNANKVKLYIDQIQNNHKLIQDMRPQAKQIIFEYMNLYK